MDLADLYREVRAATEALCAPLSPEDCALQSMPDASPVKWHLAHTSWFFETLVLEGVPGYAAFDPAFRVLFNSYYQSVGDQHPRPERGVLSRPSLDRVLDVAAVVEDAIERRSREHAALGARVLVADALVVGIEEDAEGRVEGRVAGYALEHERLEEPRGVREVPLHRAGVGHRLEGAVLRRERGAERLRGSAHLAIEVGEIHAPLPYHAGPRGRAGSLRSRPAVGRDE